jgi:hypothetical protein
MRRFWELQFSAVLMNGVPTEAGCRERGLLVLTRGYCLLVATIDGFE